MLQQTDSFVVSYTKMSTSKAAVVHLSSRKDYCKLVNVLSSELKITELVQPNEPYSCVNLFAS